MFKRISENPKLAVFCDILGMIACAIMLVEDLLDWRQESLSFTVTMPDGESSDNTEVANVAGNEDA